jgi:phenylpropionate dioxygenase-like ring-hydroxylating dioxygenase large terminal subunit/AcrR family transcriptional regulator
MSVPARRLAESRLAGSKLDLVNATISAIATHGLSGLTSARIAGMAGHTAASINFHFGSKEALLLATLREISEEFAETMAARLAAAGHDPVAALDALIDASLSPSLSDARKVAVWYAFLAESGARQDYQRICGERDAAYSEAVTGLCGRIVSENGTATDARAIAIGLMGLIDQLWQDILFAGDDFDREAGKRLCRSYLVSVFPSLTHRVASVATSEPQARPALMPDAGAGLTYTLPSWVYHNDEFFALEREHLLLPAWQVVGHVSEIPQPGDYKTLQFLDERAVVLRDDQGVARAFHNVCSHRAHALLTGQQGNCRKFITCPYHGWTYHLDGRNRSVSAPDTFPKFDRSGFGLKPIEVEVYMGFVFVRFRPGGPAVAEQFGAYGAELAHYRTGDMVPLEEEWEQIHDIDWKNVVENYVEDYHFPTGHPGLSALMEPDYEREVSAGGALRLSHRMRERPLRNWSAERYASLLPPATNLPPELRRRWTYFGLFPNVFFDVYPEWLDFFHVVPLGPGRVRLRGRTFGFPDERAEMRAARYLSVRINQQVQTEDNALTRSVQQGLRSSAYQAGILSEKEIALKGFQDWIRARLPVTRLRAAPPRGTMAAQDQRLAG